MASFNTSSSSSSCVPPEGWKYDVFLSFRGEDTRDNFVDHLYAALVHTGIRTFKDDEMVPRGKEISQELMKAIKESKSAVVVFSENYAHSSWCLDELAKIIECQNGMGQIVLPVFYHVDPSDVRGQKRNFATAFQQHEEKFPGEPEKLKRWKEALVAASHSAGWDFTKFNGGESGFISKIVRDILGIIKPQATENNLIGIEHHMDELKHLLDTEDTKGARVLGICEMGGIGKTTIAQAFFRRNAYKFEGSSFVKDVRENTTNEHDKCALQHKILSDILMVHCSKISDSTKGAELIQENFSTKKILLVLDDVDNFRQLELLGAIDKSFGSGSIIIITTRNEHLLVDAHVKYRPKCFHIDQAVELFSRHAFRKNSPPEGYEELSYRAIHYTGYLPLALKVLGSFFRGRKSISEWENALDRLGKDDQDNDIFTSLKLSYDGLTGFEKEIFLDIACFFKGKDTEHVTRILDSFGFFPVIGIRVLIEKSLVTVANGKLGMHDVIQEMGWQIVRKSDSKSRLWELEQINDRIRRQSKLKKIEAIVVPHKESDITYMASGSGADVIEKMINIRLLDVRASFTYSKPNFLSVSLRWLCWQLYPFFSLPVGHLWYLVGLDISSGFVRILWEGHQNLPNLKYIDLSDSVYLQSIPDVSGAPNIERFILSNCRTLTNVHESLGLHKKLVYLDMGGCHKLICLPSMTKMESLETLILSDCPILEIFPEVSPSMVKLSKIYLDGCRQIKELPLSIGYLSGLTFLNLISCINLTRIPNSICKLKNLKSLHLHNCKSLHNLPEELGSMDKLEELLLGLPKLETDRPESIRFDTLISLCSLRKLDLSWRQIEERDFPQNLHAFSSLEELNLSGNCVLTQLPVGISHLSLLKLLEVNKCSRLQYLNSLPSGIQVLKARCCSSLEKIGDLSKEYEWLYKAWFLDCHKLLNNQENERYINNMLQLCILKKCASVNHRLSIGIPGSNVPSWFQEKQHGCNVALKLPPNGHTKIMGFAICGVYFGDWEVQYASPQIIFKIVSNEKAIPNEEVDPANASAVADNANVWISYMPFDFFQRMYHDIYPEDWSHIEGSLVMTLTRTDGNKSVRCGAHIVYKDDLDIIQLNRTCMPDFGNLVQVDNNDCYLEDPDYDKRGSGNTYVYEEKSDDKDLNLLQLRSRKPFLQFMDRMIVATHTLVISDED